MGTIFAAHITVGGDYRQTLFYTSCLFIPAIVLAMILPVKERD